LRVKIILTVHPLKGFRHPKFMEREDMKKIGVLIETTENEVKATNFGVIFMPLF
jgi:predicted HTH transcriptional regulator